MNDHLRKPSADCKSTGNWLEPSSKDGAMNSVETTYRSAVTQPIANLDATNEYTETEAAPNDHTASWEIEGATVHLEEA